VTTIRTAAPTFHERYRAYTVDGLFVGPPVLLSMWIVLFVLDLDVWWAVAVFAAIWTLSWASMWSWIGHGQTRGMRGVGLRLVTDAGREPDFRRALVRAGALFVGLIGVVQLSVLLSTDGRYFHDRVSGTRLIKDPDMATSAPERARTSGP
jgi:uncharacterized RDD family membrane protein YckC